MLVGIGVDVCDVGRMQRELAREGGGFRDQVFTPREIAYCETRRCPAIHFAGRFAAKEAVFKALGGGTDAGSWREVEVRICESGRPEIALHGRLADRAKTRNAGRIHVSLTEDREQAIANVVLETADEPRTEVQHVES